MSSRGGANNRRTGRVVTTSPVANTREENKLTFNRILSVSLVLLFVCVIALQVTCTLTIWEKHEEIVDKFDCTDEKCCPLFIDLHNEKLEYGSNIFCYFVAYGSSFSAVCSAVMIVILVARIIACKWSTACSIVDGVEVMMTALLTCIISMVVSLGKSETCHSLEDHYRTEHESENCADIYLYGSDGTPHHTVRVHFALLLAEISSWTAVAVMSLIAIISWSRVFQWATKKCCSTPQQLVSRPQLVIRPRKMAHGYRLLQDSDDDDDNNNGDDVNDDDEPLPL